MSKTGLDILRRIVKERQILRISCIVLLGLFIIQSIRLGLCNIDKKKLETNKTLEPEDKEIKQIAGNVKNITVKKESENVIERKKILKDVGIKEGESKNLFTLGSWKK